MEIINKPTKKELLAGKSNSKSQLMIEVALNSIEKNNSERLKDSEGIYPLNKTSSFEKRISESMSNLKIENKSDSPDKPHNRPISALFSRGFCGSDMTLNTKQNKKILPIFNLSLTEGGIKPFSRSHARNNNPNSGNIPVGTQSFCCSPSPNSNNPSPMENNSGKLNRRSMQNYPTYTQNNDNYTPTCSNIPEAKQTNSELESYMNESFKDNSINNESGNRRPLSLNKQGNGENDSNNLKDEINVENEKSKGKSKSKGSKENIKSSKEHIKNSKEDIKKSVDSVKSDNSSEKRNKASLSNRLSQNVKKMFFLSFKNKNNTNSKTDENQELQNDILVNTMKKRYEKN